MQINKIRIVEWASVLSEKFPKLEMVIFMAIFQKLKNSTHIGELHIF